MSDGILDVDAITKFAAENLAGVGESIANLKNKPKDEVLDSLASMAVQIMQTAYTNKKADTKVALKRSYDMANGALRNVNYKNAGTMIDIGGEEVDAYAYSVMLAEEALDSLGSQVEKPMNRAYKDSIQSNIKILRGGLATQKVMNQHRTDSIARLTELKDRWDKMYQSDPVIDAEAGLALMNDMISVEENIETKGLNAMLVPQLNALKNQMKQLDVGLKASAMDVDDTTAGIQTEIKSVLKPYIDDFMAKGGYVGTDEYQEMYDPTQATDIKGKYTTYTRPQADYPVVPGSNIAAFEAPDITQYKEALEAFNKYELLDIENQAANMILTEKATKLRIFDRLENMAADPTKANMAMLISHGKWGDRSEPIENLAAFKNLSENDQERVKADIYTLNERDKSGLFVLELNKLQTDLNSILPAIMRAGSQQELNIDQELANQIEFGGKAVNLAINEWNKRHQPTDEKDISIIPVLAPDKATLATVDATKIKNIELLENIITKERGDFFGRDIEKEDPTGIIRTLVGSRDASVAEKDALVQSLVNEYLLPKGGRNRQGDVDDMFDNDAELVNIFYSILQSFQNLQKASPLPLSDQIGMDLDNESSMLQSIEKVLPERSWEAIIKHVAK